uniref:NB-ARC domain-containing protein n=1 Tax=Rhizophora mucronata TaxID=61149 RepID=A0A2P2JJS8_RHIMU
MSTNTNGSGASSAGKDVAGNLVNGLASGVASGVAAAFTGSALNVVGNIASPGFKFCEYVRNLDKNRERLKDEAKKLCARMADVSAKTNSDRMKQPNQECRLWNDSAHKLETEICTLLAECKPAPSNYLSRGELSKCLADKAHEVHRCWEDGSTFTTDVMVKRPPERFIKVKAPKIDDKPTLYGVVERTLGYLRAKDLKTIGLWGMVGVGKTAIMQNLNNDEQIAKMFDIVIFATLSGAGNGEEPQYAAGKFQPAKVRLLREIAERLMLNIGDITDTRIIASRILEELKGKKYLLLLDDVWETIDLEDIGISETHTDGKVVLASRHRNICKEKCSEIIHVGELSSAEAKKLFKEKLGQRENLSSFGPFPELVVRECFNFPLLIDRVARTFKLKERILQWDTGLKNLRKWPNVNIQGVDEVLDFLRFCYEELDDEDKKVCFLYGALYSEGYEIFEDYLLECWRAEGFTARHSGCDILVDLINVSLLERCEKMKHVRMNKILRNMALKISSEREDLRCLVRANEELEEPPEKIEWTGKRRISLMDNKLCKLPDELACDRLSTLLLQGNGNLTLIPELFF